MAKLFTSRSIIRYTLLWMIPVSLVGSLVVLNFIGFMKTVPHLAHATSAHTMPTFDHVVIVIEENQNFSQIIGSAHAPYINTLAEQGAVFTNSHAIAHPSEPNYLALFAGSTFGLSSDVCPKNFSSPDLGGQLATKSYSFAGYSETMPNAGYTGCFYPNSTQLYARKHNPWADFSDTSGNSTNKPFTSFPSDFTKLPTVSFVVPNQKDDMHSASVSAGDTWLKKNLNSYVQWAKTNNSLFILTWDEDNHHAPGNHIATIFVGSHVKVDYQSSTHITHYTLLDTLETMYGLGCIRNACKAGTITDVWM